MIMKRNWCRWNNWNFFNFRKKNIGSSALRMSGWNLVIKNTKFFNYCISFLKEIKFTNSYGYDPIHYYITFILIFRVEIYFQWITQWPKHEWITSSSLFLFFFPDFSSLFFLSFLFFLFFFLSFSFLSFFFFYFFELFLISINHNNA